MARTSTRGTGMPCLARYAYWASSSSSSRCGLSRLTVPSGLVSVMPQAWMTRRLNLSKARIMLSGAAEPPTTMRIPGTSFQRSGSFSSACRMPSQIVGTPAVAVTRSRS